MTRPLLRGIRAGPGRLCALIILLATLTPGGVPLLGLRAGEVAGQNGIAAHVPDLVPLRRSDLTPRRSFDAERAPFPLRLQKSRVVAFRVAAITVLPGGGVSLRAEGAEGPYRLEYSAGTAVPASGAAWRWTAPSRPGSYALRIAAGDGTRAVHLNAFVLEPRSAMTGEYLNGYRIGRYARHPTHPAPRGFVRVAATDEDILVSPHFTLGQFASKQPGSPRYLALSPPLVAKLEALLEAVNAAGHDAPTLHVMSGFRTPWYNRSIGNRTTLSRHLWGDAADVFVDTDGDGYMDDLNGDGKRDVEDARWLFDQVERIERSRRPHIRIGGLSVYRRNRVRGPFLHVDTRGRPARW